MENEFTSKEEFNSFGKLDKNATLDGYGQGQYQCYCKSQTIDFDMDILQDFCYEYNRDMVVF